MNEQNPSAATSAMDKQPQTTMQKYGPLAAQFLRFAVVGVVNTGIDFAISNALMWATGVSKGTGIIPIKAIGFVAANVNSYVLNKKWTFKDKTEGQSAKQFSVYLSVSLIGMLLNVGTTYLITTHVPQLAGASDKLWANFAFLVATGVSMVWNFIGYKLIVFRGK